MQSTDLQRVCEMFEDRYLDSFLRSDLSVTEVFALRLIHSLKRPTVLEFANKMGISQSNGSYLISKLIEKGYLAKECSAKDRRVYHLVCTPRCEQTVLIEQTPIHYLNQLIEGLDDEELAHFNSFLNQMEAAVLEQDSQQPKEETKEES